MVFGDSRDLFAVLVVDVGLKGFTKTDKEEGVISFSGTIEGRILYGEYKQGVYCTIYIQRKQFDPLYEQKIPVFSNVQINLCDFFECDSKATPVPDPEHIKGILGLGYFSLLWGDISIK